VIAFDVLGTPAPKGSARAMLIGGRARLIASSSSANAKRQRSWSESVRSAATLDVLAGAVWVSITFRLARPRGHYGKRGLRQNAPLWPVVYPDIDKLVRCTLDALTGMAFKDDSQVVSLYVGKTYAVPGREGARIMVGEWPEPPKLPMVFPELGELP
jgi:Holliday junction resolvase RusA-like endonuclease